MMMMMMDDLNLSLLVHSKQEYVVELYLIRFFAIALPVFSFALVYTALDNYSLIH